MKLGQGEAIRKMVDTWFVTKYEYIQLGSDVGEDLMPADVLYRKDDIDIA